MIECLVEHVPGTPLPWRWSVQVPGDVSMGRAADRDTAVEAVDMVVRDHIRRSRMYRWLVARGRQK